MGAFGVFCLGALLGVPAIVTGRKALRAIEQEPHRWRGAGAARAGIVLGWISVVETAFFVTFTLSKSLAAALAFALVAIAGLTVLALAYFTKLSGPFARVTAMFRKAPLAIGLSLGGVLLGGLLGIPAVIGLEQESARRCATLKSEHAIALREERFDAACGTLGTMGTVCKTSEPELASLRQEIDQREAAANARKEAERKAEEARRAEEREKNAVATFPEKRNEVASILKKAQAKIGQGKVEDANDDLTQAQQILDELRGTSVEQTKEFAALVTQIADKRNSIQPQLDRIAKKRAEQAAAAALVEAIRGPKPVNSAWDGSVPEVERYLRMVMHDWKSYEHVRSSVPRAEGDSWVVVSTFRGANAFGAKIITTKKFYIQQRQVVRVVDLD